MAGRETVPSEQTVLGGLTAIHNGLAREHVEGYDHPEGQDQLAQIQRARILAAMVAKVAERGVANVTVAHVVAHAGISRRTFYELFADREECFLAAFDDAAARASRYVLDGYDPGARWVERVRSALVMLLEFLEVNRYAGQLLIVGSLSAGQRAIERRQRCIAQISALVDEGRNESKAGAELPPLTAEGVVGGALSVLHSRLLASSPPADGDPRGGDLQGDSPRELTGALMSMIVLPYLGPAAARREFGRPVPKRRVIAHADPGDPLREVGMRLTYRTMRVLSSIAEYPGASNRQIGRGAGLEDQGQISKLLARLQRLELVQNTRSAAARGAPNAWDLTQRGWNVQRAIAEQSLRR
jgi:AcrR family transcriptional regulator/DNA-binding MarR family transcriptional regulator